MLAAPAAGAGTQTRFEERFGLERLGTFPASTATLRPDEPDSFYELGTVTLPAGASQGPDTWYAGHLHLTVSLARLAGDGRVYVSGDTAERTFAQLELEAAGTKTSPAIRLTTYDLFLGDTDRVVPGSTVEIFFTNYLQDEGVRGGPVPVRLHVEQFGAAEVEKVVVHRDSALETTARSPYPLAITIAPLDEGPAPGDSFRVRYTLTPGQGSVLRHVVVEPSFDANAVRLLEPLPRTRFATLRADASDTFVFQALRPGRTEIAFLAQNDAGNPTASLVVVVAAPVETSWDGLRWGGLGLLLAGLALVAVAAVRRHRGAPGAPAR